MFTGAGTDSDWVTLGRRTRGTGQVWSDCDLSVGWSTARLTVMADGLFMVISSSESTDTTDTCQPSRVMNYKEQKK